MTRASVVLVCASVGCAVEAEVPEGRWFGATARTLDPGCVGSPYPTIQAAIDDASNGDRISICAGTYTERLTVNGKALRFVSASGLLDVVIDGQTFGTTLAVTGGADVSVSGIALVNGNTTDRGGNVSCTGSTFTMEDSRLGRGSAETGAGFGGTDCVGSISDSTFVANAADWQGGGAWITGGSFTFERNTFENNDANGQSGGALYAEGSPDLFDNLFDGNTALDSGGGALIIGSTGTFSGNTVTLSASGDDGAGIYFQDGTPLVTDNVFEDNDSGDEAGALRIKEAQATILDNVFTNNDALDRGGAMKVSHIDVVMTGNRFEGNTAPDGGAAYLFESASTLTDNVFEGNVATWDGGALFIEDGWGGLVIEDCTFVDNEAGFDGGHLWIDLAHPTTLRRVDLSGGEANRGGAIFAEDSILEVENSVIRNNDASQRGGALYLDHVIGHVENVVVWGNDAPAAPGMAIFRGGAFDVTNTVFASQTGAGAAISLSSGIAPIVRYADFFQNPANVLGMQNPVGVDGNISTNPRFRNPTAGDYRLRTNSPLLDGGDPAILDTDGSRSDIGRWGGPGA